MIDELGRDDKAMALYVAKVVRDAIEDLAAAHLPESKMREFNATVRNESTPRCTPNADNAKRT